MTNIAILLAGGLGTRLRKMVKDVPKPMAEVKGRPFLEYLFDFLISYKVKKVVLSVGYKKEIIIGYFGDKYRELEITYAVEDFPLGTGGAVKNSLKFIDDNSKSFFIINADTILGIDLENFSKLNKENCENATISIFRADQADRFGKIDFDKKGVVINFCREKCNVQDWGNGGFYSFKNKGKLELVLNSLDGYFSFENEAIPRLVMERDVNVYRTSGPFLDIGVPDDYLIAEKEVVNWRKS